MFASMASAHHLGRRRDMIQAWQKGVRFIEGTVKVGVAEPCDVVLTSRPAIPSTPPGIKRSKA